MYRIRIDRQGRWLYQVAAVWLVCLLSSLTCSCSPTEFKEPRTNDSSDRAEGDAGESTADTADEREPDDASETGEPNPEQDANPSSGTDSHDTVDGGQTEADGSDTGQCEGTPETDNDATTSSAIYTAALGGQVRKLDSEGTQQWVYYPDGIKFNRLQAHSVATDRDGFIYAGYQQGETHKISPDGERVWRNETVHSSTVTIRDIAVDADGHVYTAGGNTVRKLEPDGSPAWRYAKPSSPIETVAVGNEYVYAGDTSGDIYKVTRDGEGASGPTLHCKYTEHDSAINGIAVDTEGHVYTGSRNGEIHRFDSGCDQVWTHSFKSPITSLAIDGDENVYAGMKDGRIYKLNENQEKRVCRAWEYTAHDAGEAIEALAVDASGFVYSGSRDKYLHKIEPDGEKPPTWRYQHSTLVWDVAAENEYRAAFPDVFKN